MFQILSKSENCHILERARMVRAKEKNNTFLILTPWNPGSSFMNNLDRNSGEYEHSTYQSVLNR